MRFIIKTYYPTSLQALPNIANLMESHSVKIVENKHDKNLRIKDRKEILSKKEEKMQKAFLLECHRPTSYHYIGLAEISRINFCHEGSLSHNANRRK